DAGTQARSATPAATPRPASTQVQVVFLPATTIDNTALLLAAANAPTAAVTTAVPPVNFGTQGPLAPFLATGRGPGGLPRPADPASLARIELAQVLGQTIAGRPDLEALGPLSGGNGGQTVEKPAPAADRQRQGPERGDDGAEGLGQALDARPARGEMERVVDEALEQVLPGEGDLGGLVAQDGFEPWMMGLAVAGTTLELTRRRALAAEAAEEEEAKRRGWRRRLGSPTGWEPPAPYPVSN